MPLGIVSESDFAKEVQKIAPKKLETELLKEEFERIPQGAVIKDIEKGRGNKDNTPSVIREIVAEMAMEKIPAREVSRALNVSESSVSAYKVGATSTATYNQPNPYLKEKVDDHRDKLIRKAKSKLDFALDSITPDKLEESNALSLSGIAKNMSAIVRDLEPQDPTKGPGANIQFVFMAPKMRAEDSYDVIEVSE